MLSRACRPQRTKQLDLEFQYSSTPHTPFVAICRQTAGPIRVTSCTHCHKQPTACSSKMHQPRAGRKCTNRGKMKAPCAVGDAADEEPTRLECGRPPPRPTKQEKWHPSHAARARTSTEQLGGPGRAPEKPQTVGQHGQSSNHVCSTIAAPSREAVQTRVPSCGSL